jgi:hypothetical protein
VRVHLQRLLGIVVPRFQRRLEAQALQHLLLREQQA